MYMWDRVPVDKSHRILHSNILRQPAESGLQTDTIYPLVVYISSNGQTLTHACLADVVIMSQLFPVHVVGNRLSELNEQRNGEVRGVKL